VIRSIIKDEEMQYYKFELMVKLPPMQNKIKKCFRHESTRQPDVFGVWGEYT